MNLCHTQYSKKLLMQVHAAQCCLHHCPAGRDDIMCHSTAGQHKHCETMSRHHCALYYIKNWLAGPARHRMADLVGLFTKPHGMKTNYKYSKLGKDWSVFIKG